MIERSADYEPNDKPNDKRGTIGSPEERQNEKKGFDNPEHYPKTPSGFQCFVCGKQYGTNEERIEHLEEACHMVVCMILLHLRKGKTLDDSNNTIAPKRYSH